MPFLVGGGGRGEEEQAEFFENGHTCNSCDHQSRDPRNSLAKHRASEELWKTT